MRTVALVVQLLTLAVSVGVFLAVLLRWHHLDSTTRCTRLAVASVLMAGSTLIGSAT